MRPDTVPPTNPLREAPLSEGFEVDADDWEDDESSGVDGLGGGSVEVCDSVGIDAGCEDVEADEAKVEESNRVPPHCGVKDAVYIVSAQTCLNELVDALY